jgi:hypothetical protein
MEAVLPARQDFNQLLWLVAVGTLILLAAAAILAAFVLQAAGESLA